MAVETNKEVSFAIKERNIRFTNREIDIISCLLAGRSSKKIAAFLCISPKTVENHIRNIMVKLECNSRENIIDFLEKSESFQSFKQHYSKILVKMAFELELKKIAKYSQKQPPRCLNIYYSSEKEKPSFIIDLEKYLQIAGIIVSSYNWDPAQLSKVSSEKIDYVIYSISKDFAKRFKHFNGNLTIDEFKLNQIGNKNLEVILLLMEKLDDHTYVLFQKLISDYIDANKQTNYYFFIFEILKRILVDHKIEKNIESFSNQYNSFLSNKVAYNELVNQSIIDNPTVPKSLINYITSKKAVLILGLLLFVFTFINFDFNRKKILTTAKEQSNYNMIVPKQKYLNKGLAINLPQRNHNFTGREQALDKIKQEFNSNDTEFTVKPIIGLGGVGKTQLVTEFAYQASKIGGYQLILWVAAETSNAIFDSYRKIADYFQINVKDLNLQEIQLLIHKYLASTVNGKKILFVLDNVPDNNFIENYLSNLYQQANNYFIPHVVITARSQSFTENPLILEGFDIEEATSFIKKQLPNESEEFVSALAKEFYYFPLALSQATAYIKIHSNIDDYLKMYKSNVKKYLATKEYFKHESSLWETWNITLSKISDNAKSLLFIGSYLEPDNIPIEFFDNLTVAARTDAIKEMRNYSLITLTDNNKAFKIHRLLQEVIRIKNEQDSQLLASNAINKALELIEKKFDFNYLEFKNWAEWVKYIEHARILAGHAIKTQGVAFSKGVKLFAKVAMFKTHILNEFNEENIKNWLKLLELIKSNTKPNSMLELLIIGNLGFNLRMNNNLMEAKKYFENAIGIYEQKPKQTTKFEQELANILRVIQINADRINLSDLLPYDYCYLLNNLGHLYNYTSLKDPNIAMKYYNQSLQILDELEKTNAIKNAAKVQKSYLLYHISRYHISLNELTLAESLLNTAKKLLEEQDLSPLQQSRIYSDLAKIHDKLGEFEKVEQSLKQAIDLIKNLISGQHTLMYSLKPQLGCNAYKLGNFKRAQEILQDSINYWENSNNNYYSWFNVWFSKLHLSRVYELVGKYEEALQMMEDVVNIVKKQYPDQEKLHKYMKFKLSRAENWVIIKDINSISIDYLKKMLSLNMLLFGESNHHTAKYHQLYGQFLVKNKQYQPALEQYSKSMKILEQEKVIHKDLIKFHNQNIAILQNLIKSINS